MIQAFFNLLGISYGTVLSYEDLVILFCAVLVILFTVTSFLQFLSALFRN